MTARTVPITPRVGLSLVHHPTTRLRVPTSPAPRVNALQWLLARWRRSSALGIHWEERDRLRHEGFPAHVDAYTWLPRPLNAGRRNDW